MKKLNKNIQKVSKEFFWEIPGDVPGYRVQPDPFQGIRTTADSKYQLPAHSVIGQDINPAPTPDPVAFHNDEGPNTTVSNISSDIKSFNRRSFIALLLLMLAVGLVGYNKYFSDADNDLNQVVSEETPATQAEAKEKPKIFELILGKQTSTPQSKLRIVTHVVVKGDTLWDIAEVYVKDPFRYPELAKLSKIKNPDLIYPYDLVRIHIYE